MYLIISVLFALFYIALLYCLYKVIWYALKMIRFKSYMHSLSNEGVIVVPQRKFTDVIFGKKGCADYIIEHKGKKYEVSVLSFISVRGRLNIEKTRTRYFIESRHVNKLFYKIHVNTNTSSNASEYKNETRISRKELTITPVDTTFEKQIFLIYPKPQRITYTDTQYKELYVGNMVDGHVIMDIREFDKLLFPES